MQTKKEYQTEPGPRLQTLPVSPKLHPNEERLFADTGHAAKLGERGSPVVVQFGLWWPCGTAAPGCVGFKKHRRGRLCHTDICQTAPLPEVCLQPRAWAACVNM